MTIRSNTLVYGIDLGNATHALEMFKLLVDYDDDDCGDQYYDVHVAELGGFYFYCDLRRAVLYDYTLHGINDQHDEYKIWPVVAAHSVWHLKCLDNVEHDELQGRLQNAAQKLLGAECRTKLGIFSIVV